ncbi:MAG: MFS transporter [Treponema sp.]|nr:MFS transporter [Treponema sp.]MCL2271307.1 MFS transporter [Treponema sp.]
MNEKLQDSAGWLTTAKERRSYLIYFSGQNTVYTYVFMFLTSYLLLCELDAASVAGVLIVVKIWDAVNDCIFGSLMDKLKFRKGGKFIPWIRISLPAIIISTLLLFSIPQSLGVSAKLIWFTVSYILWDTAYTLCDVPVYGLVTTMTNAQAERTDLMTKSRITAYLGVLFAMGLGYVLPAEQVGLSFTSISYIVAGIAAVTMIWLCINGREGALKSESAGNSYTIREMFRYFAGNKYLFIYYGGLLLFSGFNTATSVLQFACFYLFNSAMIASVVAMTSFLPAVIISLFMPSLLKKIDKYRMFIFFAAVYSVLSVVIWLIGPVLVPHLILCVFRGIALGGVLVLQFMFTPDCAEYGQYKTGIEAKGITFAIQTFTMKLVSAVSASLGLAILGWFGWKSVAASSFAELAALGITQSASALSGLWTVYALMPGIGSILAIIIWLRYKLKTQDVGIMARCNSGVITREECEKNLSRTY